MSITKRTRKWGRRGPRWWRDRMDILRDKAEELGWAVELERTIRGRFLNTPHIDATVFIVDEVGADLYECESGDGYHVHPFDFGKAFLKGAIAMKAKQTNHR